MRLPRAPRVRAGRASQRRLRVFRRFQGSLTRAACDLSQMRGFARIAASRENAIEARLPEVPDDFGPPRRCPILLRPGRTGMHDGEPRSDPRLAKAQPRRRTRGFGNPQARLARFRSFHTQAPQEVRVVIRGVKIAHARIHEFRVRQPAKQSLPHPFKSNTARRAREPGGQSRAVGPREIEHGIPRAGDHLLPGRPAAARPKDDPGLDVRNGRQKRRGSSVHGQCDPCIGPGFGKRGERRHRQHEIADPLELERENFHLRPMAVRYASSSRA